MEVTAMAHIVKNNNSDYDITYSGPETIKSTLSGSSSYSFTIPPLKPVQYVNNPTENSPTYNGENESNN